MLPLRAIPPGNGMITPSTERIALAAASDARSADSASRPSMMMLPPATPSTTPKRSWTRNSPSITGTRQYRCPSSTLLAW